PLVAGRAALAAPLAGAGIGGWSLVLCGAGDSGREPLQRAVLAKPHPGRGDGSYSVHCGLAPLAAQPPASPAPRSPDRQRFLRDRWHPAARCPLLCGAAGRRGAVRGAAAGRVLLCAHLTADGQVLPDGPHLPTADYRLPPPASSYSSMRSTWSGACRSRRMSSSPPSAPATTAGARSRSSRV